MITIDGREFSEDTIKAALKAHCEFEEKYVFKAGDVAKGDHSTIRIIVMLEGKLKSFNSNGDYMITGQEKFETMGYRKIGTISDYIK